jgi:serine/threonine protein phosphatase PrpC
MLSADKGAHVFALSYDHKPHFEDEHTRIERNGGYVYRTDTINANTHILKRED